MMDGNDKFSQQEKAFLLELSALSRKHGVIVSGCGCCGSPSLYEVPDAEREGLAGYGAGDSCDIEWFTHKDADNVLTP